MTPAEIIAFESDADFEAALALRRADDAGKVPSLTVRPVAVWQPVITRVAAAR